MWDIPKKIEDEKKFTSFLEHFSKNIINHENFIRSANELLNDPKKINLGEIKCKDGRIFEYYSQPQKLEEETIGRVYSFHDITKRMQLEQELKHQASHDSLTGLPNRVFLEEILEKATTDSQRNKDKFAVLFFDLNRFKLINDSLNHAAGDELLRGIANRIQSTIRSCDIVARLGGDEFVVILREVNDEIG